MYAFVNSSNIEQYCINKNKRTLLQAERENIGVIKYFEKKRKG